MGASQDSPFRHSRPRLAWGGGSGRTDFGAGRAALRLRPTRIPYDSQPRVREEAPNISMSRDEPLDLAVCKSVKLSLSTLPHSPRIKLVPGLLRTLRIGAGRPAILKLNLTDDRAASASSSSPEPGQRTDVWVAGAVWPYKPEQQDKRAASGSRSASSSQPVKPQEGIFPQCLYPGLSSAGDDVVDVEVFPAASGLKREAEELQWAIECSHGTATREAQLSASSREILAMVVKELLSESYASTQLHRRYADDRGSSICGP